MRKVLFVLLGFVLVIGCSDDSTTTGPDKSEDLTVAILGLPQAVDAPYGTDHEMPFTVLVRNSKGSPAADGTLVNFESRLGVFTEETAAVSGNFGAAETFYIPGNQVGVDTLRAWVDNGEERVYSNEVLITLVSGPPSMVSLTADPRELFANDPDSYSTITATVLDASGNPVREGLLVSIFFETTLGTITPSAITVIDGRAVARLRPGVGTGVAEVTATIEGQDGPIRGRTTVTFLSGMANSIQLEADPLELDAAGAGGNSSSTLRVTVRDAAGNLVEWATTVVFELLNEPDPPRGCNINGRGSIDSSRTANGVATATLNAGTETGGKMLRAYTWRDSARRDTVSAILTRLSVTGGAPARIAIDLDRNGEDAGGGAWVMEVSARVTDSDTNPVGDNVPVIFTVEPEIATVSNGATGNEGMHGRPASGVAYATLVYNSRNTFSPIAISAEVQAPGELIAETLETELPLQRGEIVLHVDPENWMFEEGNEEATIRVWAVVRDGHGTPINYAPVLFNTNRGRLFWFNYRRNRHEMFYPDPARKRSGVVDQENQEQSGTATVFLIVEEPDVFLDPFTMEMTVQLGANVEGYDGVRARPQFVQFTRHGR